MKIFRTTILAGLMLVAANMAIAQHQKFNLTWQTDITKAYEISKKTKKPVFAFFTGSDWCGWCHKLEKAVFQKPGFQAWAKKNVVMLELDFPRQTELPEKLARQNAGLQSFFKVEGFPSIWIFHIDKDSSNGKFNISPLGSLGYPNAAPGQEEATFLKNANAVLANKK